MRLRTLLLLIVMVALCTGGTFTCTTSTHDDDHPTGPTSRVSVR